MFKNLYENISNAIYQYACLNGILLGGGSTILFVISVIAIILREEIGWILFGCSIFLFVIGTFNTMMFFAISKLIKNGDRQFEQNKEIIRLLSERK